MKQFMFILVVACLFIPLQATVLFQAGLGIDVNGKQTFSNDNLGSDSDVNTGVSLYGEVLSGSPMAMGELMFGVGMEYQVPRELKNLNPDLHKRQFSYLPIYATLKYVVLPTSLSPELILQGGYNFLVNHKNFEYSDTQGFSANGGFYWAAGVGMDFKPFIVQLMYKSNKSEFEWDDVDLGQMQTNSVNTQLSLQLGIRL